MHLKLYQSWWSFAHYSSWPLHSFFPSARSCSLMYLPSFLSRSILSKSIFYTVQLTAEFRKMPFENLSPDVLLVGQRIPGCSSGQLPQDRQFWEKHDKLPCVKAFWRRQRKTSSDRPLSGKRDFKNLGRVYHKTKINTPSVPNLSRQLAIITGELQHGNERPRWELFNLFLSGKVLKPPCYGLQ